jgi:hypothetical protein
MPSSGVSDGVQSLITTKYPGTIFCAVETSGDGATNFYSRVQMYLYKARIAAEQELEKAFTETGVTREQVEQFLAKNKDYASALHHSPHKVASSAANLVYEIAPIITKSRKERRDLAIRETLETTRRIGRQAPGKLRAAAQWLRSPETHKRLKLDAAFALDLIRGKAEQTYGPLVSKLARKAFFENNSDYPQQTTRNEPMAAE